MTWGFADRWDSALTYDEFVAQSTQHCGLWTGVYRLVKVPEWAVEQAMRSGERFRLVVLSEDWCGDATNTVPVLAKWAAEVSNVELRILRRDEHPDVMDRYLTNDVARSIPVVIVLTEQMEELGWWGPRPTELQRWVMERRREGAGKEIYPEIRRWYAKDRGETTLREVLGLMSGAAAPPPGSR